MNSNTNDIESRVIKAGANELKLLEFNVGKMKQGINLVKIKGLLPLNVDRITPIFNSPEEVLGLMDTGTDIFPVIDMDRVYDNKAQKPAQRAIIVAEFNQQRYGFAIDHLDEVHRVSWTDLQPVEKIMPSDLFVAVAVIKDRAGNNKEIMIVDFETIVEKLYPATVKLIPEPKTTEETIIEKRAKSHILFADDSKIIRKKMEFILRAHKFENYTICTDGLEAWNKIEAQKDDLPYNLVVTDIEMPQMNGLTLCQKIKEILPDLPVLIMSSLISEQLELKCNEVHANESISKNNIDLVVTFIDKYL